MLITEKRQLEMLNILIANTLEHTQMVLSQPKFVELWPNLNYNPPTETEVEGFFNWLYEATKTTKD